MKVKTNLRAGSGANAGGVNKGGVGGGGSANSGGVNGGHGADNPTETPVVYTPPVVASRCVGL